MTQKYFVGVDEAGYGPNLGPLIVAASVWTAPADFHEHTFSQRFTHTFLPHVWTAGCPHVPLGDSKKLYQAGSGLSSLEAGLLAMLQLGGQSCLCLGQLLQRAASPQLLGELQQHPWYVGCENLPVPKSLTEPAELQRLSQLAAAALTNLGLELVEVRAAVITEHQFNRAVARSNSKGQLLSQTSLQLVASITAELDAPVEAFCDRQGGRKNYLPNLLDTWPDQWFVELAADAARSSYQNSASQSLKIHFSVGGDSFPPTALASMLAKYLRERLMEQLNAFWQQHLPDLKPTAGYPVDAKRFRQQIEPVAARLKLSEEDWWRCR